MNALVDRYQLIRLLINRSSTWKELNLASYLLASVTFTKEVKKSFIHASEVAFDHLEFSLLYKSDMSHRIAFSEDYFTSILHSTEFERFLHLNNCCS